MTRWLVPLSVVLVAQVASAEPATPQRHADRTAWKVAMWTSIGVVAVGGGAIVWGREQVNDAQAKLCAGGAYAQFDPTCPGSGQPLSQSQVKALNDQGFRGRDVSLAGGLAVVFAGTAAVVAGYEAYVREEPRGVIVAPVAGPGTAGAVASWRW